MNHALVGIPITVNEKDDNIQLMFNNRAQLLHRNLKAAIAFEEDGTAASFEFALRERDALGCGEHVADAEPDG